MENPLTAAKIKSQARQWTLAGDCSLLEWMKQISQNLEQRSDATTKALQQLSTKVKRTHIALDNAANSLTALQYSQFVESRCHNDDETIANPADVPTGLINASEQTAKSSNEIIKTFLQNNLEMLQNCHEKYVIDFEEDSDDEDTATNFIYQPKNPYNERLLPHIYGSKLWRESWHVGLCDNANDYSGDEGSEEFSESSTSPGDNDSYESTTNLSEWASSTSITNEKFAAVQNASSLRGSQSLYTEALAQSQKPQQLPPSPQVAAGSDSRPAAARMAAARKQNDNKHDLFDSLENTPPLTSPSSSASSSMTSPRHAALPARASNQPSLHRVLPPLPDEPPDIDLFDETAAAEQVQPETNQIKRKPVNLFDDDDFNSFMTEIADKAQAKTEVPPVAAARKPSTNTMAAPSPSNAKPQPPMATSRESRRQVVDLFASRDNSPVEERHATTQPIAIEPSTRQPQPQPQRQPQPQKPVNLFESPEASPTTEEALFSYNSAAPKSREDSALTTKTKLTAKSLFDDDDEDDDFLNVFHKDKPTLPKSTGKSLLFDNDDELAGSSLFEEKRERTQLKGKTPDLFMENDAPPEDNFENQAKSVVSQDKATESIHSGEDTVQKARSVARKATTSNLFADSLFGDDNDDDYLFGMPREQDNNEAIREKPVQPSIPSADEPISKPNERKSTNKSISVEVFSDEDDLFSSPVPSRKAFGSVVPPEATHKLDEINNEQPEKEQLNRDAQSGEVKSSLDDWGVSADIENREKKKDEVEEDFYDYPPEETSVLDNPSVNERPHATKPATAHTYTGIFLDEPPDDDDFFETLGNSQLSTSKLTLDLEHDFYEPALPLPPAATAFEQKEASDKQQQHISGYGGLSLFSEIPPDDDGADYRGDTASSETKRVHSVFYDDCTETLEALQKPQPANASSQSLFGKESLPDDPVEDAATPLHLAMKLPPDDEPDHRPLVMANREIEKPQEHIKSPRTMASEITRTQVGGARPAGISKLQMPKININVQALMPNVAGKPSPRKSLERTTDREPAETTIKATGVVDSPILPQSVSSGGILTNVCKTRVRVPAKRRPSTRQARQENYRKSLLSENADVDAIHQEDNTQATEPGTEKIKTPESSSRIESKMDKGNSNTPAAITGSKTKNTFAGLFADDDDNDDDFIFKPSRGSSLVPHKESAPPARSDYALFDEPPVDPLFGADFVSDNPAKDKQNVSVEPKLFPTQTTGNTLFGEPPEDRLFEARDAKDTKVPDIDGREKCGSVGEPKSSPGQTGGNPLIDEPPEDTLFADVKLRDPFKVKSHQLDSQEVPEEEREPKRIPVESRANMLFDEPPEDSLFADKDVLKDEVKATQRDLGKNSRFTDDEKRKDVAVQKRESTIKSGSGSSVADPLFDAATTAAKVSQIAKDEDPLFGDITVKTPHDQLSSARVPETKIDQQTNKNEQKQTKIEKKSATALFGDSDDEEDDLFKTVQSTRQSSTAGALGSLPAREATRATVAKASNANKRNATKPLFGAEQSDDDDDDLFKTATKSSTASGRSLPTPPTRTSANDDFLSSIKKAEKAKGPSKNVASLFSDTEDDDDDDLFGGSASKPKVNSQATRPAATLAAASEQQAKPASASGGTKSTKPSANVSDNPLADLFN